MLTLHFLSSVGIFWHSASSNYELSSVGIFQHSASNNYELSSVGIFQHSASNNYELSFVGIFQHSASNNYEIISVGIFQYLASDNYEFWDIPWGYVTLWKSSEIKNVENIYFNVIICNKGKKTWYFVLFQYPKVLGRIKQGVKVWYVSDTHGYKQILYIITISLVSVELGLLFCFKLTLHFLSSISIFQHLASDSYEFWYVPWGYVTL